jgi:flagellar biosynthesis protein FlhG
MPHESRLIAIASGKGGVGKTWFSITLAHALSRLGRRVLLFDADFGLANIDVQLGIMPTYDLGAVLDGKVALREAVARHPDCGFDILAGRSGSGALADLIPDQLEALLAMPAQGSAGYDDVLLDLGAGVERAVRRMGALSDILMVLATEEPTSLTDAYAVLKLHRMDRPLGDARIAVNQVSTHAAGERTYLTLRRACSTFLRFEPKLAGIVRRDDKVRDAIRRQSPLLTRHPSCLAAMDIEVVAQGLAG